MKHLLPMARANVEACAVLCAGITGHKLSTQEVGQLSRAWREGTAGLRARVLAEPLLFLKARREMQNEPPAALVSPAEELLKDLDLLGAMARRTLRRFTRRARSRLSSARSWRAPLSRPADLTRLHRRWNKRRTTDVDDLRAIWATRQADRDRRIARVMRSLVRQCAGDRQPVCSRRRSSVERAGPYRRRIQNCTPPARALVRSMRLSLREWRWPTPR
jgi:hypothetical protein